MTKEKALIILNECRLGGFARTLYTKEEYCTARDMAIRALEEQETVTEFADRCRECGAKYGKLLKQEPCEDAISRQAVLDGLASIAKAKAKSDAQKSLMGRVMFFTEHLPSVKPQEPKWIPVSERLPEKHGRYLAYIVGKYDTNYRYIMTCEYFESDLWCWFPDDECTSDNVVAWMSLPEPYKAESEDEG